VPVLTYLFCNNSHPNRPTVIKISQTSVRLTHTNLPPLANQAPRVPAITTNLKAGAGPLPTLVANRAARVAPPRPPAAATLLAANRAARLALQRPATTTVQHLTAGVGPLPTLAANRAAARVALPRPPAAATLLVANRAARVALQRPAATTSLKALGVGPLPTLAANRAAARVALPRLPATTILLMANRAARVSLLPATLGPLEAGVLTGVQLPATPRPHLPCVTLQSLHQSL
jgi:hypothetical protein